MTSFETIGIHPFRVLFALSNGRPSLARFMLVDAIAKVTSFTTSFVQPPTISLCRPTVT